MDRRLRHMPCQIVQQLLIANGQGTNPEEEDLWPVYYDNLPDSPNSAIRVLDTDGSGNRLHLGPYIEKQGVQILVRSEGTEGYHNKTTYIAKILDEIHREEITLEVIDSSTGSVVSEVTYRVNAVHRDPTIRRLGREREGGQRFMWSLNAIVDIEIIAEVPQTGTGS